MGTGHNISCNNCGYCENLLFERGFSSEGVVLFDEKTGEIRNILEEYVEDFSIYLESFKEQGSKRSKKKRRSEIADLVSKGWKEIEGYGVLEKIVDKIRCPECGRVGFDVLPIEMQWD